MQNKSTVCVGLFVLALQSFISFATAECGGKKSHSEIVYIGTYGRVNGAKVRITEAGNDPRVLLPPENKHGIYAVCFNEEAGTFAGLHQVADVQRVSWIETNPELPVLYATGVPGADLANHSAIYSYQINRQDMSLHLLGAENSGGTDATHINVDSQAKLVFVGNHGEGVSNVFPVLPNGSLGNSIASAQDFGAGPHPRQGGPKVHSVSFDPSRNYLLTADFGADRIFIWKYDSQNHLLTPSKMPFILMAPSSGPRMMKFSPNGKFLYVLTELSAEVYMYRWNSGAGTLEEINRTSLLRKEYKGRIDGGGFDISKNGEKLYVSIRAEENSIVVLDVNEKNEELREIQRIPTGGIAPWSVRVSPSGKWLLSANVDSNSVIPFKVDPKNGMLTNVHQALAVYQPDIVAYYSTVRH